ncbi:hypothetical protein OPQ81_012003 [Rhizoctonia solani]|nr:hypothetical protein OPQ81_012003 [Rhizoctonia solani]
MSVPSDWWGAIDHRNLSGFLTAYSVRLLPHNHELDGLFDTRATRWAYAYIPATRRSDQRLAKNTLIRKFDQPYSPTFSVYSSTQALWYGAWTTVKHIHLTTTMSFRS